MQTARAPVPDHQARCAAVPVSARSCSPTQRPVPKRRWEPRSSTVGE